MSENPRKPSSIRNIAGEHITLYPNSYGRISYSEQPNNNGLSAVLQNADETRVSVGLK